ncbi:hypothetical protein D9M68_855980 [compost metagenome]
MALNWASTKATNRAARKPIPPRPTPCVADIIEPCTITTPTQMAIMVRKLNFFRGVDEDPLTDPTNEDVLLCTLVWLISLLSPLRAW